MMIIFRGLYCITGLFVSMNCLLLQRGCTRSWLVCARQKVGQISPFSLRARDQLGSIRVGGPLNCKPCVCFWPPYMPRGLVRLHWESKMKLMHGPGRGEGGGGWGGRTKTEAAWAELTGSSVPSQTWCHWAAPASLSVSLLTPFLAGWKQKNPLSTHCLFLRFLFCF